VPPLSNAVSDAVSNALRKALVTLPPVPYPLPYVRLEIGSLWSLRRTSGEGSHVRNSYKEHGRARSGDRSDAGGLLTCGSVPRNPRTNVATSEMVPEGRGRKEISVSQMRQERGGWLT